MEFGFRAGGSARDAFRDGFDLVDAGEAWGLDSAWLAEFHFMPDRSVLSSPIVLAGAIAARTKRMRIGTAVYVLPLTNPLRVAEEIATLDQVSEGRLDFGIGRSGFARQYKIYDIDYGESQARFAEAVAVLREAWKGERFSFEGTYFQVRDALVVPEPLQKPHPPMRIAAASPGTYIDVAEQGVPLFVGLRGDGLATLKHGIASYRDAWRKAGHDGDGSVYLRVPLYAAATEAAALEEPRRGIEFYFERQARMVAESNALKDKPSTSVAASLAALTYKDILESRVCFGTAPRIVDRLREWREVLGIDGIVIETNAGNMLSAEQERASLRIVTHEVMPALK